MMARTWRFLSLIALVLIGAVVFSGSTADARVQAQRNRDSTGSCPVMVHDALELLGDNCDGVQRNSACYGYFEVDASFVEEVDPDMFDEPSDLASLTQLASLRTAPVSLEDNRWGIAVMEVQANVPNTLPGQSVIFLLMGDAEIQNAVDHTVALEPVDPVNIVIDENTVARTQPASNANAVGDLDTGAQLATDALSADSEWLRVVVNGQVAWVPVTSVAADSALARLPVITPETRTPMQSFYFSTGIGNPQCNEAPNAITVRSRRDMEVDLTVNGVDVTIGSTITFRNLAEDEVLITVQEGHLETSDGRVVERGQSINAIVSQEGDVAVWGDIVESSSLDRQIGAISYLGLNEVTPEEDRLGYLLDYLGVESLPAFGGDVDEDADVIIHEVQDGETLFSVARLYDTSIARIIADNGLMDATVETGQQLLISQPGVGYIDYENTDLSAPDTGDGGTSTVAPSCEVFAARSPLNGLNRGVNAFYWTPLEGATSYRVRVRNLEENIIIKFDSNGTQTGLAGTINERTAGDGMRFAWDVQALVDNTVACTSPLVTLPRATADNGGETGLTVVEPVVITQPDPGAIAPVVDCVVDHFDGTYTARFGYVSDNVVEYSIPAGSRNTFGSQGNRGQPTVFSPGSATDVVRVSFNDGQSVTWTLNAPDDSVASATASVNSSRCFDQPMPLAVNPVVDCVINHYDGTYTARFDSDNANPGNVRILTGADNRVSVRGGSLPVMIAPGRSDAFAVKFTDTATWTLRGPDRITRTATATTSTRRCADQPPPLPVIPVVDCIIDYYDTTFEARFGFDNRNPGNVLVPLGNGNIAAPEAEGTPPTMLSPGRASDVIRARFSLSSGQATWTLTGPDGTVRTATATPSTQRCSDQPPPLPVTPSVLCVIDHYDGRYTARFNVNNENFGRVHIDGGNNVVTPANGNAPVMLRRGTITNAMRVTFSDTATWTLRGPDGISRSATATIDTSRCSDQPSPDRPVIPQVECVIENFDLAGETINYTARFGYFNDHTIPVNVGIGGNNNLSIGNGVQPSNFAPWRQNNVFSVDFDSNVVWTLRGLDGVIRSATANAGTGRCADQPPRPVPGSLSPVLECVTENFDPLTGLTTGYTARFGYANGPASGILIAANQRQPYQNFFSPGGNLGQPSVFGAGRAVNVFTADFAQGNLVWHLNGRTATASVNSARCSDQPARPTAGSLSPIAQCVIENYNELGDVTGYTARFGYQDAPQTGFGIASGQSQPYNNSVTPGGNVGQPGFFNPGVVASAFAVDFTSGSVTWNLNGRSATLSADSTRCSDQTARPLPPIVPVAEGVVDNCDGTFTVTFGYINRSQTNMAEIPVGSDNALNPGNGAQPTLFEAGAHGGVFTVRFEDGVMWTVRGASARAEAGQATNVCPTATPEPTFTPLPPQEDPVDDDGGDDLSEINNVPTATELPSAGQSPSNDAPDQEETPEVGA